MFVFWAGPLWKEHWTGVMRTGFDLDPCFLELASTGESSVSCSILIFSYTKWEQHGVWRKIEWNNRYARMAPQESSVSLNWFWENFECDQGTRALNVWAAPNIITCEYTSVQRYVFFCIYNKDDVSLNIYRVRPVSDDQTISLCLGLRGFPRCRTYTVKTQKIPGKLGQVGHPPAMCELSYRH